MNSIQYGIVASDILAGTGKFDFLLGGDGDDVYYFSKLDGNDLVEDSINAIGLDTIHFNSLIQQSEVVFYMDGADLKIGYSDMPYSSITIRNQADPNFAIERFELSDGSYLISSDVNHVIQAMANIADADGISLTSIHDVATHAELMAVVNAAWHQ